jgi:dTDP-glucose 4,6-dehydratase
MHLDDGRVVPNFLQQALQGQPLTVYGDGSQTRSFCYVDDLIEGIYRLLLSDEHLPVNIGNPVETTILEFAERINEMTGNKGGITFNQDARGEGDPQRRQPDISRAKEIIGWEPKISVEDGLMKTIPYFKEKMSSV